VRLLDLVGLVPLALLIAVAVGAVGRHEPQDVVRTSISRLGTLVLVVGCVAGVARLLIAIFV
jgi:hypothetical protein